MRITLFFCVLFFAYSSYGQGVYKKNLKRNGVVIAATPVRVTTLDTARSKNKILRSNGGDTIPTWVTLGTNLSFSNDTINVSGGGSSRSFIYYNYISTGAVTDNKWVQLRSSGTAITYDPSDTSNNATNYALFIGSSGTLKNFAISPAGIGCNSDTITMTVYKNGVPTPLVAALKGHVFYNIDNIHTVSCLAGDYISVKFLMAEHAQCMNSNMNLWLEFDPN